MAGAHSAGRRVLVLSDDERLTRAIELNLSATGGLEVSALGSGSSGACWWTPGAGIDLLIVAASSPASEPVVLLARAALACRLGQVPILVISDRPFCADPVARIAHLSFPFRPDCLHHTVMGLLQEKHPRAILDKRVPACT